MKHKYLFSLLLLWALYLPSLPAHAWVTEVLDQRESGGQGGGYACMSVDSADGLHIVSLNYRDSPLVPAKILQYSTNASGSWETEIAVDMTGLFPYPLPASVAVDSADKVHFIYGAVTLEMSPFSFNVELKYATNVSGSWVTEDVDSGRGKYAFMALDSSGKAHISADDHTTGGLKYATNVSGSWVTTVVDSGLGYFTSMSLSRGAELWVAVDSSDKVHISYCDVTNEDLKYATNASGSWVTTTVDSVGSVGRHTSIAIDSSDKVHISYYDATNEDLKHATNASGSWVTEIVDSGLGYSPISAKKEGRYTSIAIDSSDRVHINYYDSTAEELKYATNASGSWIIETVESGLGTMRTLRHAAIVLDSSDKAHISLLDDTNFELKHATNASGSWASEIVPSPTLMGGASVVVDSLGKNHVGYAGENVKYATDASGPWVTEVVDPVEGGDISIALDSSEKAHFGYSGGGSLKFATNASGSWVTTDLGFPGAHSISIALDSSEKAHISLIHTYDDGLCLYDDLWYGNNASGPWVFTLLESVCFIMEVPYLKGNSIAVDSLDNIHIAYGHVSSGYFSGRVMYVTNQSGSWSRTPVDAGVMPSVAVDSLDKVHISYMCGGIRYATNRSGSWLSGSVAAGGYPRIAVDTLDKVHISYTSSRRTMYTTRFGSSWVSMIAADRPPLGCGSGGDRSIAVTPEGSVRIGSLGFDATLLLTSSSPCVDKDGDGCGDPATPECPCPLLDCDDAEPQVNPELTEGPFGDPTCSDTLDNDCDGGVDAGDSACCECIDTDSDGYGDPGCENCPYAERDCDNNKPNVNPGASENCSNGIDDDCDGETDALDSDCSPYSAAANAEASMYGSSSVVGSGVFNELALLLIPVSAILVLRILRRRR